MFAGPARLGAVLTLVVLAASLTSSCSSDAPRALGTPAPIQVAGLAVQAGYGPPDDVELPDVTDPDVTRSWLMGEGAAATRLVVETEELWQVGVTSCGQVAADLDTLGSPEEVLAAAVDIPDPVTAELLTDLHAITGHLLAACTDEASFARVLPEFAWQWSLAERRLQELGAL